MTGRAAACWPAAVQPYPGLTVDCATRTVTAITDANGVARFDIVGAGLAHPMDGGSRLTGCAQVRADPGDVPLGTMSVAVYDQDGRDGLSVDDVWLWRCDYASAMYYPRSDYNHDYTVGVFDFQALVERFWQGGSQQSGARCDGQRNVSEFVVPGDGGLDLAWGDCYGAGGSSLTTFACNTNTGTHEPLVGSVVLPSEPALTHVTGIEAEVYVIGPPGAPLADWFRFDRAGCRSGALVTSGTGGEVCPAPTPGLAWLVGVYPSYESENVLRLVFYLIDPSHDIVWEPGAELELFRLLIGHQKTVGTGACAGCSSPVDFLFNSVKIYQGGMTECMPDLAGKNVLIQRPDASNFAFYQSPVSGVPGSGRASALSLWPASPNPGRGTVTVGFTLPSAHGATLDLLDITGRRVASHDVPPGASGAQRLTLGDGLRPGVYFVRLRQGSLMTSLKAVVVR